MRSPPRAVLLFPHAYLPFQQLVPWANLTLTLPAEPFVKYHIKQGRTNPLSPIVAMAEREPERVREMQRGLLEARWHLLYHRNDVPTPGRAQSTPAPSSAGKALVHHLVLAAQQRVRAALPEGDDGGACGRSTLGDIDLYRRGRILQ